MKETTFRRVIVNLTIISVMAVVCAATAGGGKFPAVSGDKETAIYRGNAERANISLMINVYWGTEHLDGMLDTLAQKKVKTTFFVGGSWAADNHSALLRIKRDGHEIANHGTKHKDATKQSTEALQNEILSCERTVESITGVKTRLFAPPSGAVNKSVVKTVRDLGYETVMWTQDTIDWRDKSADLVYKRATATAANGNLILMHPTAHTAAALPGVIDKLRRLGYTLTTVSETV